MSSSNPSLPPAPVAPPMGGGVATSSSPIRRRARDTDDNDDAQLEEGELRVPVPVPVPVPESSDTEDDANDDGRRYEFHPRVEHDDDSASEADRYSPRLRASSLDALDALLLGAGPGGALLPSYPATTTPSAAAAAAGEECESDATISDDDDDRHDVVERGWAATGRRGCKAGGKNKYYMCAAVLYSDSDSDESGLDTGSAGDDDIVQRVDETATGIIIPQAAAAAALQQQQQPPPPLQAQPLRALQPPPPPRRKRERPTEYTCKVCGKSYSTNQALGGHAAGHRNKQREAEAMAAAAAAAAAGGGASVDAAFPFPLHRGGGKVNKPHECRHCGKVFGTGVALGGHMRVHYTGPPIVPDRKNKKRCLAPLPPPETAASPVGLSLGLSIKAEENVAAAQVPPAAVAATGLSFALSVKAEEESPSTPPAAPPAGGAVSVVRLFGIDISPHAQQAPLQQQQQQGSGGDTTEDSSSTTGQEQH